MEGNPYKAPRFDELPTMGADAGLRPGASTLSETEIWAFVGKNANYYIKKWPHALEEYGRARGFNWAAFLLSGIWVSYRKMYRVAFMIIGIIAGESALEEAAIASGLTNERSLSFVGRLVSLILSVVFGAYGNAWYLAHAKHQIMQIRALGLPDDAYHAALARRGGTSVFASLGVLCAFIAAMFIVGFTVEFLLSSE